MICSKCGKEINEDTLFCTNCGQPTKGSGVMNTSVKDTKGNKKVPLAIAGAVLVIIIGVLIIFNVRASSDFKGFKTLIEAGRYKDAQEFYQGHLKTLLFKGKADGFTEKTYKTAYDANDYSVASALYNNNLIEESYKLEVVDLANDKISVVEEEYLKKTMNLSDALVVLDGYSKFNNDEIKKNAKGKKDKIIALDASRKAFEDGSDAMEKNNYQLAFEKLSLVISEDDNYSNAQTLIKDNLNSYRDELIKTVNDLLKNNKYAEAISKLQAYLKIDKNTEIENLKKDAEEAKKAYEDEQEKLKIEQLRNSQQAEVISTKVWDDGYSIVNMKAEIVVKNNTNKVIKNASIGFLSFDANGYPVKVEYDMYKWTYDNEQGLGMDSCNIEPGKTFGKNWCYNVHDRCKKGYACVRNVEFMDGTTWNNPYYSYWLKTHHEAYVTE